MEGIDRSESVASKHVPVTSGNDNQNQS
jgi:hypothetical protein